MSTYAAPRTAQTAQPRRNRKSTVVPQIPTSLDHMAEQPRFVLWKYGSNPNNKGKYPKMPMNPHTGKGADVNDPATWGTWADCVTRWNTWPGFFDGIGTVMQPGETGVDYDDCIQEGTVAPDVAERIVALHGRAYMEVSVNGGGVHLITLGTVPDSIKHDDIEIYPGGCGRFFTLSGRELEGSTAPGNAQDVLDALYAAHAPKQKQQAAPAARSPFQPQARVALTAELAADIAQAEQHKAELLQRLRKGGMTKQLANLLYRNVYPPAMKDTTDSGARAVVVFQLDRSQAGFTDGELAVVAEHLIRKHGYTGQHRNIRTDILHLLGKSREGRGMQRPATVAAPQRQRAPEPLQYLRALAEHCTGDTIMLNQEQRATIAETPLGTAKRVESELVNLGWIERGTYSLRGPGNKGRSGSLTLTEAGKHALNPDYDPVTLSHKPAHDPVNNTASPCVETNETPCLNTSVVCSAPDATPQPTHDTHTHTSCSLPAEGGPLPDLADAVYEAYCTYRSERTSRRVRLVVYHVMNNFPGLATEEEIAACYRDGMALKRRWLTQCDLRPLEVHELKAIKNAGAAIAMQGVKRNKSSVPNNQQKLGQFIQERVERECKRRGITLRRQRKQPAPPSIIAAISEDAPSVVAAAPESVPDADTVRCLLGDLFKVAPVNFNPGPLVKFNSETPGAELAFIAQQVRTMIGQYQARYGVVTQESRKSTAELR